MSPLMAERHIEAQRIENTMIFEFGSRPLSAQRQMRASQRLGATLAEVLIALLIMGIGLTSLASLFPIAILQSVQANQLTVGTTLRYNAEAMLSAYPNLLNDPDNNGINGDHLPVGPPPAGRNFIMDPLGGFSVNSPSVPNGSPMVGALTRFPSTLTPNLATNPNGLTPLHAQFYFNGVDNWINRFEGIAASSNSTSVTFNSPGASGIALDQTSRIVLYSTRGTASTIRSFSNDLLALSGTTNAPTYSWSNALPTSTFPGANSVGKARVESQDPRFTWMYTAREGPASSGVAIADVTIVVFYKRSYAAAEEVVFDNGAGPILGPFPPAQNNPFVFSVRSTSATIQYPTNSPPYLKKGSYVLDAGNGFWYRIQNFVSAPINATLTSATLTLDKPALAISNGAVFYKGIVDVYPIGLKTAITN